MITNYTSLAIVICTIMTYKINTNHIVSIVIGFKGEELVTTYWRARSDLLDVFLK